MYEVLKKLDEKSVLNHVTARINIQINGLPETQIYCIKGSRHQPILNGLYLKQEEGRNGYSQYIKHDGNTEMSIYWNSDLGKWVISDTHSNSLAQEHDRVPSSGDDGPNQHGDWMTFNNSNEEMVPESITVTPFTLPQLPPAYNIQGSTNQHSINGLYLKQGQDQVDDYGFPRYIKLDGDTERLLYWISDEGGKWVISETIGQSYLAKRTQ